MGLKGNLTAGEIIEQLLHASAVTPIHNVVFMVRRHSKRQGCCRCFLPSPCRKRRAWASR